ncbi:MAG TPA: cytochrome P450 [Acidimicrobiales bacterium]|nr:cytochrome P450 [Acidimicrobiales bacterium]
MAGIETTQRLIANAVYALGNNRSQLERAAAEDSSLVAAIEETLRLYPPNQFRVRYAHGDQTLNSTVIRGGDRVLALLGGANRDTGSLLPVPVTPHRGSTTESQNAISRGAAREWSPEEWTPG